MAQPFVDLPQMLQSRNQPDPNVWEFDEHDGFFHPYKHGAEYPSAKNGACFDSLGVFDHGMASMQPMQRFMLDQESPLSAALLNGEISVVIDEEGHCGQPWLLTNCNRNASPDRTSLSEISSHATQNEFHAFASCPLVPYSSPLEFSQSLLPYLVPETFHAGQCFSDTQGGNISLRDLEYEHREPEMIMEEMVRDDMKQQMVCMHEHDTVESDATPHLKHADSGMEASVRDAESVQPIDICEHASDSDYDPMSTRSRKQRQLSASKVPTRRRPEQSQKPVRASPKRRRGDRTCPGPSRSIFRPGNVLDERRSFPCPLTPYGCVSAFSSKNEWKRHINTQHIKLGYWRCDLCPPLIDPKDDQALYYNDFNRKDLFTQHLRRMHATPKDASHGSEACPVTEDNLPEHQTRCLLALRTAPRRSLCLFCVQSFKGPASWEEWIEHVGRHLEKDRARIKDMLNVASWNVDLELEQYLLREGLIKKERGQWKIGNGRPMRHAKMDDYDDDDDDNDEHEQR